MMVDERQIREAVERVLASEGFVASPTLAAFLRYVVDETMAGRGDRLKAYSIAIAALDRPTNFDPNENPLVRVQARRLRSALDRYYVGVGRHDPIRIEMPLGAYVPVFAAADEPAAGPLDEPDAEEAAPDDPPPPDAPAFAPLFPVAPPPERGSAAESLRPLLPLATFALLVLTAIAVLAPYLLRSTQPPQPAAPAATVATAPSSGDGAADRQFDGLTAGRVLPQLFIEIDTRGGGVDWLDTDLYRRRLEGYALRFDDLIVVTRRSPLFPPAPGQPLYHLRITLVREGASTNAYHQLTHAGEERVLASGAYHLTPDMRMPSQIGPTAATPEDLIVVRGLIRPNGPIWSDAAMQRDVTPTLACLARALVVDLDDDDDRHLACDCLERVVAANSALVPALTLLAEMRLADHRRGLDAPGDEALTRAETALARALALTPASASVEQRLGRLLLERNDVGGAIAAALRAVEANPADIDAVGTAGIALACGRRPAEAFPFLRRAAAEATSPRLYRFFTGLVLADLDRPAEADLQMETLAGGQGSLYAVARLLRGLRRADARVVADARKVVLAAAPAGDDGPATLLRSLGLPAPAVARLIAEIAAAGPTPVR